MVFIKGEKIEIEKFHPEPLLSSIQAVTSSGPNFYRTLLIFELKSSQRSALSYQQKLSSGIWLTADG
jgi:hypothetical protein